MPKPPLIETLTPRNILSFGSDCSELRLGKVNIFIGPNGSGKSNLIELLRLLKNTSGDLLTPIREGGGVIEWIWKGDLKRSTPATASVELTLSSQAGAVPMKYVLEFTQSGHTFEIVHELLQSQKGFGNHSKPYIYFENQQGRAFINDKSDNKRSLRRDELSPTQSVFSQRKDPDQFPELTAVGKAFDGFALYQDWEFGINTEGRSVQRPDQQSSFLEEDASNLGLILQKLRTDPTVNKQLLKYLRQFYPSARDIFVKIDGGLVEIRIEEEGGFTTPASRLSDGTIRWLALLAVFLNPTPAAVTCIEEPELGLHPDIMSSLADLIKAASEKTQLFITTHSRSLIDSFSDTPASVYVVEKEASQTNIKRLDSEKLSVWLEQYSLGTLWSKGEIGGNRW